LAAIKQLVPRAHLTRATAQNQIRFFGATVVGPPIGGWLFGVAALLPFLCSALAFVGSALLLRVVGKPMQEARPGNRPTKQRTVDGFRFILRQPILLYLIVWIMGSNMAFNHTGAFLAVIATAKAHHATSSLIGITLSIAGCGGIVGALLASTAVRRIRPAVLILAAAWVGPAAALLLATVPSVPLLGVILAVVFIRAPITNALFFGYVAALVPDELQGRVLGAVTFLALVAQPIGVFGIGAIFDAAGRTWVFAAMGIVSAIAALPTLTRRIRSLPTPEEARA
jgi:predicted MFS family arabinose efflux permease